MPAMDAVDILLVDDEDNVREVAHSMLEMRGHRVRSVSSGNDALDSVRKVVGADAVLLRKPFSADELARAIARRMTGRAS